MAKTVFERTEKKYRLSEQQYHLVLDGMLEHMRVDSYGKTTICSVYYDDQSDRLIRTSIQKPVYKEKLRLRAYGIPDAESTVFVELKKKFRGVVYKRRAGMKLSDAERYLSGQDPPGEPSQILREITWVRDFYRPVPRAYIAYDRIALECPRTPGLRVTFDSDIRARSDDLSLSLGDRGEALLSEGERIMEIKVPSAMPLWMSELLARWKVYPTSFSKYGTYYQKLIGRGENNNV